MNRNVARFAEIETRFKVIGKIKAGVPKNSVVKRVGESGGRIHFEVLGGRDSGKKFAVNAGSKDLEQFEVLDNDLSVH